MSASGVNCRCCYLGRLAEDVGNSCSYPHHYSEVDTDQFTPEIITSTIAEAQDAPVDQIDSTTLALYLDLEQHRVIPMPVVYTDLHSDNLVVEDPQRSDAIDPSATQVSESPPYANAFCQ